MEQKQFKSTILWEAEHKLSNMEAKTSKTGATYFLGELNKMFKIVLKENKFKPGQWTLSLVPVKYEVEKPEQQPQTVQQPMGYGHPSQYAQAPAPAPAPKRNYDWPGE